MEQSNLVKKLIYEAKTNYYSELISDAGNDCHLLFKSIDHLLHLSPLKKLPSSGSSKELANTFVDYFTDKIVKIRCDFPLSPVNVAHLSDQCKSDCRFDSFSPVSYEDLSELCNKLMSKSCELDPIPASLLQNSFSTLPVISKIVNTSLETGYLPSCLKSCVVRPLMKNHP